MATINDLLCEEDLLVEIFSYYIQSEGHVVFSRNIPRVCKAWNEISSRTKSPLWKDIKTNDWNYLVNMSRRGLLCRTQSLKVSYYYEKSDIANLSAVLKNSRNIKAIILDGILNGNSIQLLTQNCQQLERVHLSIVVLASSHEWDQFLTVCGPRLKNIDLSYHYDERTEQQLVSGIAAKCPLLERLEFHSDFAPFPIHELRSGCPNLKELIFSRCNVIADERNDYSGSGLMKLNKFAATFNDFNNLDVYEVLKDSSYLEHLELVLNKDVVSDNISKISAEKVKFLHVSFGLKVLIDAVSKWRKTLSVLNLTNCTEDINSILHYYMLDNPNPQLETLAVYTFIDTQFFREFLKKCKNLTFLKICWNEYKGREEIGGAIKIAREGYFP